MTRESIDPAYTVKVTFAINQEAIKSDPNYKSRGISSNLFFL